jgi:hypothetical protein
MSNKKRKMTDKEAFEIFNKYSDEPTRAKMKIMLYSVGVDKTVENMVKAYSEGGKTPPDEFVSVMKQAFTYVSKQMSEPLN